MQPAAVASRRRRREARRDARKAGWREMRAEGAPNASRPGGGIRNSRFWSDLSHGRTSRPPLVQETLPPNGVRRTTVFLLQVPSIYSIIFNRLKLITVFIYQISNAPSSDSASFGGHVPARRCTPPGYDPPREAQAPSRRQAGDRGAQSWPTPTSGMPILPSGRRTRRPTPASPTAARSRGSRYPKESARSRASRAPGSRAAHHTRRAAVCVPSPAM